MFISLVSTKKQLANMGPFTYDLIYKKNSYFHMFKLN